MANNNQQPNNVNNNNPCSDPVDEYFRKLPPGIRLRIFDDELVDMYLFRKVHNLPMIPNRIHEVDLYDFHPQELADTYQRIRSKEWFFFTHRYRKYPNGRRPRRAAADGYWKPTGTDKPIPQDNPRGYRKCLDYYEGKHPEGFKTIWKMHEYTLISQPKDPSSSSASPGDKTKLGDWVLCKIYKKRTKQNGDEETVSDEETEFLLEALPEFAHNNAQVVEEPCPDPGAGVRNGHETIDDQQVTKFAPEAGNSEAGNSEAGSNLQHSNESCQLKSSLVGHCDLTMEDYLYPDFNQEGLNTILAGLSQPQEDNNNLVSCESAPQPPADSNTDLDSFLNRADGLFHDQASIRNIIDF